MTEKKKCALITGGSSGIGYELAKLFIKDGYNLILVARDENSLNRAADELADGETEVWTISKDLFQDNAPYEVYDKVRKMNAVVDVLVNDAGQGQFGKFTETDLDRELDLIRLNIIAPTILTKLFIRDMVKRGSGKILNLSSIASKIPGPYQAVYHATKAYVHFFTEAVRSEIKDTGVSLTSLLPGATDTDFFNKADMTNSKIYREGDLADPAKAAKDGYEALMKGEDHVVSGMKNKFMIAAGNVSPDEAITDRMKKMQEPVDEDRR